MSILNRQVMYSVKGGQVKFLDWAVTSTTIGSCVEPFIMNDRSVPGDSTPDYDPSDMMVKVDGFLAADDDDHVKRLLAGGSEQIHGGNLQPRVLIFTGNN